MTRVKKILYGSEFSTLPNIQVEPLYKPKRRLSSTSYFSFQDLDSMPLSPRTPLRNKLFERHHIALRNHLARRSLYLSYAPRGEPLYDVIPHLESPFALKELIPSFRHWFNSRPARSVLWFSLLLFSFGSRKTLRMPQKGQPIFIASITFWTHCTL